MIEFDIHEAYYGEALFTAEINARESTPLENKKRLAVEWALDNEVPLNRTDLSGANLRYMDLRGVNLSYADLRRINLSRAILTNADLSNADLRQAYLYNAYLIKSDLRSSNMECANLKKADLREADLRGSSLNMANLELVNLQKADVRMTEGLFTFGPMVEENNEIVRLSIDSDLSITISIGHFKDQLANIEAKHGKNSTYAAVVSAMCAQVRKSLVEWEVRRD